MQADFGSPTNTQVLEQLFASLSMERTLQNYWYRVPFYEMKTNYIKKESRSIFKHNLAYLKIATD